MPVKTIQAAANALAVLELLSAAQPIGVSALARLAELDKNGVQRILLTLAQEGWAHQLESGEWSITSKALRVGTHFTAGIREAAHPHLVSLQRSTDETVVLFALEDDTIVVIDSVDSSQPLRITVPIGMDVPLRQGASFDVFLPTADRDRLPLMDPMPSPAAIDAVRRQGWFVIDEIYPNTIAAGSPVFDRAGRAVAALIILGPRVRVSKTEARSLAERAATTARDIALAIAGHAR